MKIFKIIFNSFLILFLLFGQFGIAKAGLGLKGPKMPEINPVKMVDSVLGEYGMDKATAKNMTYMANSITNKTMPPEVTLSFSPINPKPGDKITVSAMPAYFLNQPEKLYFTWFLKTANCFDRTDGSDYKSRLPQGEYFSTDENVAFSLYENNKCNLDGDNDVDIEDYKIKAMRMIANDEFNYGSVVDYYAFGDLDEDGYGASFGGDDQNGKIARCFVHDVESGSDFQIECDKHLFPLSAETVSGSETGELGSRGVGNNAFGSWEEEFWRTDPQSKDTGHTGKTDEANVCGLGINNFTWDYQKGDQVGVAVEGIATLATQEQNSSYKTMWAMSRKNYTIDAALSADKLADMNSTSNGVTTTSELQPNGSITVTTITDNSEGISNEDASLTNGSVSIDNSAAKQVTTVNTHPVETVRGPYEVTFSETEINNGAANTVSTSVDSPPVTTQNITMEMLLTQEQFDSYYANVLGNDFPNPISVPGTRLVEVNTTTTISYAYAGPDPDFPTRSIYNQTSTITVTTVTTETSDEINVSSGVTVSELNPGDIVLNGGDMTAVSDLNDYLYNALVDPSTNEVGSQKLDVSLSYSPNAPLNDPTANKRGDTLSLISSVTNALDDDFLKYSWEAYKNDEIDSDIENWTRFTSSELDFLEASPISGLGLDTFKFKLNLDETYIDDGTEEDLNFIKIKLNVTENMGGGIREGNASIIVPMKSSSGKITTSQVAVDSSLNLSLGNEICGDISEEKNCPVTKDTIVGLSLSETAGINYSNFLWTLDGEIITYTNCPFSNCDEARSTAYFPITKESGEKHILNLTATNDEGEKLELTRTFNIIDPEINITPATSDTDNSDNCSNIKLGEYIDEDGTVIGNDFSKENLISSIGSDIIIRAVTNGFLPPQNEYIWNVGGDSLLGNNTLTLPAKTEIGENYSVSVSALYIKNENERDALREYWNIPIGDFYEKTVSDTVEIIIQDPNIVTSSITNKKIFASLFSSTPEYLAFLFRIVLTTFLIIFVSKLIFMFSPRIRKQE